MSLYAINLNTVSLFVDSSLNLFQTITVIYDACPAISTKLCTKSKTRPFPINFAYHFFFFLR
ncbi:hypothetical protein MTR_3g093490 [Medicago truncatula]|uniref:Uncharacterized protein n=1 Tax=Medicago truncatula TaxID=3880 RepID=G7J9R0_MEDTR|nr:hypothetical protein MTR_3g093490 [Medicago truncatula]